MQPPRFPRVPVTRPFPAVLIVRELPLVLEPVTRDPFIEDQARGPERS